MNTIVALISYMAITTDTSSPVDLSIMAYFENKKKCERELEDIFNNFKPLDNRDFEKHWTFDTKFNNEGKSQSNKIMRITFPLENEPDRYSFIGCYEISKYE